MATYMLTRIYLKSTALLLVFTAVSKLMASLGGAEVLNQPSPVFGAISNRQILVGAASLEVFVSIVVWVRLDRGLWAPALVLALGTLFLAYRLALWALDFRGYCGCLGTLGDALHLNEGQANFITRGILLYLLVGSYLLVVRAGFVKRIADTVVPLS